MAAMAGTVSPTNDDALTVCAISLLSAMLADVSHEGLGHGALALITGAQSGVLSTVAWSSTFDSRLVAAGGTLANLAGGIVFWIALRSTKRASVQLHFFLLTGLARSVAVKVLPAHLSDRPEAGERFEREARTISSRKKMPRPVGGGAVRQRTLNLELPTTG